MRQFNTKLGAILAGTALALAYGVAEGGSPPGAPVAGESASDAPIARSVTVTGTIEAEDKPMFGKAKSVRIVSPDEGTFAIEDAGVGQELKDHVGEKVTVLARRTVNAEGKPALRVERYEVHES